MPNQRLQIFFNDTTQQLSEHRVTDYINFCNTIWCLRGAGADLSHAHDFASRDDKYDVELTNYIWEMYIPNPHWNIHTLYEWLREDIESEQYRDFCKQRFCEDEEEQLLNDKDRGMTKIVERSLQFIFYDNNGNGYTWDNSQRLWVHRDKDELNTMMRQILYDTNERVLQKYKARRTPLKNCDMLADVLVRHEKLRKMFSSDKTRLRGIVTTCIGEDKNFDSEFPLKMNNTPHLLPIANGQVVDLQDLQVRNRTPKDYFSWTTEINYTPTRSTISNFLQTFLGYCMTGRTDAGVCLAHWQNDCVQNIIQQLGKILGKFCVNISKETYSKTALRGGSQSALRNLMGVRMAICREMKLITSEIDLFTNNQLVPMYISRSNTQMCKIPTKLCIITHEKPVCTVEDRLLLDRVLTTREPPTNTTLSDDELASIAIQGAQQYLHHGLPSPTPAEGFDVFTRPAPRPRRN